MAKLFTMLECRTAGIEIEVSLNGFPLSRLSPTEGPVETQPVNQYLISGRNELSVRIITRDDAGVPLNGPRWTKLKVPAALQVRLARYPQGAMPGDDSRQTIAQLDWSADAGQETEVPGTLNHAFNSEGIVALWGWQSATVLRMDDYLRQELLQFLGILASSLQNRNPVIFLNAAATRFAEVGEAYGLSPDQAQEEWLERYGKVSTDANWRVVPIESVRPDFRLCSGGRVVECRGADGLPVIRANVNAAGIPTVRYPIFAAKVGRQFRIVR